MGTGVASVVTCSIEGDVLDMGYVIARESVSSNFKVKRITGHLVPPWSPRRGLHPGRGQTRLGRGASRAAGHSPHAAAIQPHGQQLPPPLPRPAGGRPSDPPSTPHLLCLLVRPVFLPQGLCRSHPIWDGELSSGAAVGCGGGVTDCPGQATALWSPTPCERAGWLPRFFQRLRDSPALASSS